MNPDLVVALEKFVAALHPVVRSLSRQQRKMLITMHRYLDGDAFGSAVALGLILRRLGVDSALLCVPFVPEKFDFLSRTSRLTILEAGENRRLYSRDNYAQPMRDHFPERTREYGALTILDCAGSGQIPEEAWSIGQAFPHKINIDHHIGHTLDSSKEGVVNLVGDCSSTSEVLFHLMQRLGIDPDPETAVPLYVGVNADLRKNDIWEENPAYPGSVVDILKAQVDKAGAETQQQIDSIFSLDRWEKHLLSTVKSHIRFAGPIAYASFDPDMVLTAKRDTNSLDNPRMPFHEFHIRLRQLMRRFRSDHRIAVLFDLILGKVSLFDLHQSYEFDLAGISRELGGGGHSSRAGFSFRSAGDRLRKEGLIPHGASESKVMEGIVGFIRDRLADAAEIP